MSVRCLFTGLFVFFIFFAFSQEAILQSIRQAASKNNPNEVLKGLQSIKITDDLPLTTRATFHYEKGVAHGMLYQFDSSVYHLDKAYGLSSESQDTLIMVGSLNGMGNIARGESRNEDASEYFEKALGLVSEKNSPEYLSWQAKLLGNMAGIFFDLNDFRGALEYSKNALNKCTIAGDSSEISTCHIRIGYCYNALEKSDSALYHNKEAAKILEITKDSLGLIYQYYNIGGIYASLKDFNNARNYFAKSMSIAEKYGEAETYAGSLTTLGEIELNSGRLTYAEEYGKKALAFSTENKFLTHMRNSNELLYKIKRRTGDLNAAINYLVEFQQLKDSIQRQETLKSIEEFRVKYETAEKENEIQRLSYQNQLSEAELQRTRTNQLALGIILVVITVFSVSIFIIQRQKSRLKQQALSGEISELRIQIKELLGKYEGKLEVDFETLNQQLVNPLSAREFDIFEQIFSQKSNREIADELHVSINTVKTHLKNIYAKLGVTNRSEALKSLIQP